MEQDPQTHRGAERGHPSVSGTDGQVVESNGLPVQLHILLDPQHPLHGRDQKLPWVSPRRGWSQRRMAGSGGEPRPLSTSSSEPYSRGEGPPAPPASGPAEGWKMQQEEGDR